MGSSTRNIGQTNHHRDNDVMDSIAVLRSVLMLDTPTRTVLAGGMVEPQRQPNFASPRTKTPESRKSSPIEKTSIIGKPPMSGKRPSPGTGMKSPGMKSPSPSKLPPSPEMQRLTTVLQKKVNSLETSQADLKKRLKEELDQRTTLQATYGKLTEFQTQQASQLERITASRDEFRDESAALKQTIESERAKHAEEIATMKNDANAMMESKRATDEEMELLKKKLRKKEERYDESESLVKSLTKEVEKLNADLKTTQQTHKVKMQTAVDEHAEEIASLKHEIQKMESDRSQPTNNLDQDDDTDKIYRQKAQIDVHKLKQEHSMEKEKLESEKEKLQNDLKELAKRGSESVQQVTLLQEQLKQTHAARITSEEKATNEELQQRLNNAGNVVGKEASESKATGTVESKQQVDDSGEKLKSLKQNLEEAERIELQNEELQGELKDSQKSFAKLREKLHISEVSNSQRLVELATQREKVHEDIEETEKKRDNSNEDEQSSSPRKRIRMRTHDESDDDIVL
eukprot:jgi/Psemu1/27012/gm1.27012_g